MSKYTIYACITRAVLFEGDYASLRQCIETAVTKKISLAGADLTNADFGNASLDGADLRSANLSRANLHGANLSESDLTGACLQDCDMTSACLCEARLYGVNFAGASFGSTLVTGALIESCTFSCMSALTLPFADARLGHNLYMHDNHVPVNFSAPPVVVTGLPRRLVFFDDKALIGDRLESLKEPPLSALNDLIKRYA